MVINVKEKMEVEVDKSKDVKQQVKSGYKQFWNFLKIYKNDI